MVTQMSSSEETRRNNADLETQPLLQQATETGDASSEVQNTSTAPLSGEHLLKKYWAFWAGILLGLLTIFGVVTLALSIQGNVPSDDILQDYMMNISTIEINSVHLDGWRKNDGSLSTEDGKYLQLSTQVRVLLNYDALIQQNETSSLTDRQVDMIRFTNEKILKTVCVDINNMTTFDDLLSNNNTEIGAIHIIEPICLDLHNGTINNLNMTILIKPNIKNILRVMKKIWDKKFNDISLSSNLDLTLSKDIPFIHNNLPLTRLKNISINWNKLIDWDTVEEPMTDLQNNLENSLKIDDLSMFDTEQGFDIELEMESFKNFFLSTITAVFPAFHFPQADIKNYIPSINWYVKLADCIQNFSIDLPNINSSTDKFDISKKILKPTMNVEMTGPLPDTLTNKICEKNNGTIITPLTNFLNSLFDETQLVTLQTRGEVVQPAQLSSSDKSVIEETLIPDDILNNILEELSYITIQQNLTFNMSNLIEEMRIEDMKLRWTNGRVSAVGTIVGLFDISFYDNTKLSTIGIDRIKGNLELFHNDVHFISLPMNTWNNATSRIVHEHDEDDDEMRTYLELTFEVDDTDMETLNRLELTKIFNEIFFSGETLISFDSVIDVVINSVLGEIQIDGLKTSGETTVH